MPTRRPSSNTGTTAERSAHAERRRQLGAFLRSRRERLSPATAGLSTDGIRRRTSGLRREEVAAIAGISAAWYTQLEQGRDIRPSQRVLASISRALRLSPSEEAHLLTLALPASGDPGVPSAAHPEIRNPVDETADARGAPDLAAYQHLLGALRSIPAVLIDSYWDVISSSAAAATLFPDFGATRRSPTEIGRNAIAYLLTSDWRTRVSDWEAHARRAVAGLRASLAREIADIRSEERATALVQELSALSAEFRAWWAEHEIWPGTGSVKQVYRQPGIGRIEVQVLILDTRTNLPLMLLVFVPCDARSARAIERLLGERRDPA